MSGSIGRGIFKGAAVVSLFLMLGKVMGFVQKVVIAKEFGTGSDADAFAYAYGSIVFTLLILPHKLLAPFLSLFVQRKEEQGERAAWQYAGRVGLLVLATTAAVAGAGVVFAPALVSHTSSFTSEGTSRLAVTLVRIMLPAAVPMALFWLLSLGLNADKRFALPAFGDMLNRVLTVVVLVILCRPLGIRGLALGVVAGAVCCALLQVAGLRRQIRLAWPPSRWRDPLLGELGRLMLPILLGIVSSQIIRTVLDFWFVSKMGEGYTASLGYAKGLSDTITLLVPFAVGVVVYPFFSDLHVAGRREELTDTLMSSMRMVAFLVVPLSAGIVLLRVPIVQLVFQRGRFGAESVALTQGPMLYYSLGLTAFAMEIILMRFYLAVKDTLTPVLVGLGCVVLHVAVVLALRGTMKHSSIALAVALDKTVKVAVLFALLRVKIPSLRGRRNLLFVGQALAATAAMAAAVKLVDGWAAAALAPPAGLYGLMAAARLAVRLALCGGAGLAVFVASSSLLRMEEAAVVWKRLRLKARA